MEPEISKLIVFGGLAKFALGHLTLKLAPRFGAACPRHRTAAPERAPVFRNSTQV